ncbi:hypothetical protein KR044_008983 [Drosophila immigrans]|nr:hypothetical protein KR044_008983 [Drosophila immigrans]
MMVDEESKVHQSKWFQFVEINKYCRGPLKDYRSEPCLRDVQFRNSDPTFGPTNLSLSWQLAHNPADSFHLNDVSDCVQLSPSKDHIPVPHDLRNLSTNEKRKAKMKTTPRNQNAKSKVSVPLPKIMVVDAVNKRTVITTKRKHHQVEQDKRKEQVERLIQEMHYNPVKRPHREVSAQSKAKRSYGVPLCRRPTMLLGPQYHADLQNYYQQQYYNQVMQQQQQQQMQMQEQMIYYPGEQLGYIPQSQRYAVPLESMYNNLKKGKRYCGNFYYR